MQLYLLTMSACGDVEYKLVDKECWDYIFSPLPDLDLKNNTSTRELPPENIQKAIRACMYSGTASDEDKDSTIWVTVGSGTNDRALGVHFLLAGKDATYFDYKELQRAIKKHNIEIVDTYEGVLY